MRSTASCWLMLTRHPRPKTEAAAMCSPAKPEAVCVMTSSALNLLVNVIILFDCLFQQKDSQLRHLFG